MGITINRSKPRRFPASKKYVIGRYLLLIFAILFHAVSAIPAPLEATADDDRFLVLGFKGGASEEPRSIPEGWEPVTFIRAAGNTISLCRENGTTALRVESLNSASGILKRLNGTGGFAVDLASYPFLVWRWKVNRAVGMAIESRADRNDCAARVRVIFNAVPQFQNRGEEIRKIADYLGITLPTVEPSGYKIDYIWGSRTPRGQIIDYPGEQNHKMIVLQQGNQKANRWVWEKRDLIDDFQKCFNSGPPGIVGVVIMTDTEQTHEGVEAWYGSVVIMRK
jgi:hypothetical protein